MDGLQTLQTPSSLEIAQMRFKANSQYTEGKPGRSPWIGYYKNCAVFPDAILSLELSERSLSDQLINVRLQSRANQSNGNIHFVASFDLNLPLLVDNNNPEGITTNETELRKRVAMLIDGQNFLFSLKSIRSRTKISPLAVIQAIASQFQTIIARFYICREAALELNYISPEDLDELDQSDLIEVRDRLKKTIINLASITRREKFKIDVDHLIIADLNEIRCSRHDMEGVLLFSGDSDYDDSLRRWLGEEPYVGNGRRLVWIVTSQKTLSRELRQLGLLPGVTLIQLEEVISKLTNQQP